MGDNSKLQSTKGLDCAELSVKYIFTTHAKEAIKERYSHKTETVTELLARSKIAGRGVRRYIKRECPNHKKLVSPNSKMVYWYAKTKSEGLWRVFVTTPEKATKFIVITYFELNYKKYI